jgi:hypothetical protein
MLRPRLFAASAAGGLASPRPLIGRSGKSAHAAGHCSVPGRKFASLEVPATDPWETWSSRPQRGGPLFAALQGSSMSDGAVTMLGAPQDHLIKVAAACPLIPAGRTKAAALKADIQAADAKMVQLQRDIAGLQARLDALDKPGPKLAPPGSGNTWPERMSIANDKQSKTVELGATRDQVAAKRKELEGLETQLRGWERQKKNVQSQFGKASSQKGRLQYAFGRVSTTTKKH